MTTRARQLREEIELIANDENLQKDLEILPRNYTFEIPKTIWKIKSTGSKTVALQFPEGLLLYSCVIADILSKYTNAEIIIMGDVTYGACCVDDFTARALGCDLLVHYGHSCLVPIQDTPGIHMLYIFVNIDINLSHLVDTVRANFQKDQGIALVSTIQFVASLQAVKKLLLHEGFAIEIPQCSPLSPGEILGCTSPKLPQNIDALIYVGDGRFHLESIMIQNPEVPGYAYNPYSRKLTSEKYAYDLMLKTRENAVNVARNSRCFGLILGTLGRQGNMKVFEDVEKKLLASQKPFLKVLMSEIFSQKLATFASIDSWVQVACPRLSIDWGYSFNVPLLTPYELSAALDYTSFSINKPAVPMDYYAYESAGSWTNNHIDNRPSKPRRIHLSVK
ncbi:putative diphthamide synthesis protein domain-containing protein [Ditylenchus destructor]|uniref:2-(3-amino-3-carboxypropyl)histidine synthase subunit 1 n=1 Tax=Ditylenchus destructor TaxID=166010 RepID=A0AAD4R813_9BILA|nr:putative diphthamide synthesis protein domain-containing protein [Ditylenchus destructor]